MLSELPVQTRAISSCSGDPGGAASTSQESVPTCSMDLERAESTSHESNLMDFDEPNAASNVCDKEIANEFEKMQIQTGQVDRVKEITNELKKRLIQTRQMDRLKDLMERRLFEIGWHGYMMDKCREIVQNKGPITSFETLFQILRLEEQDLVPAEVKEDILQKIKFCCEPEKEEESNNRASKKEDMPQKIKSCCEPEKEEKSNDKVSKSKSKKRKPKKKSK